jgi:hypothetical protein
MLRIALIRRLDWQMSVIGAAGVARGSAVRATLSNANASNAQPDAPPPLTRPLSYGARQREGLYPNPD